MTVIVSISPVLDIRTAEVSGPCMVRDAGELSKSQKSILGLLNLVESGVVIIDHNTTDNSRSCLKSD